MATMSGTVEAAKARAAPMEAMSGTVDPTMAKAGAAPLAAMSGTVEATMAKAGAAPMAAMSATVEATMPAMSGTVEATMAKAGAAPMAAMSAPVEATMAAMSGTVETTMAKAGAARMAAMSATVQATMAKSGDIYILWMKTTPAVAIHFPLPTAEVTAADSKREITDTAGDGGIGSSSNVGSRLVDALEKKTACRPLTIPAHYPNNDKRSVKKTKNVKILNCSSSTGVQSSFTDRETKYSDIYIGFLSHLS